MRHAVKPVVALLVLTLACLGALSAVAQQRNSDGQLAPPSGGYGVFIIGDALAGGLWAGTTRVTSEYPEFSITGRFKEESGLARPEIYDWGSAVPKILERHHVDIAVVFIGSNDGQDIRTEDGSIPFGSPDWEQAYDAAVHEIIRAFQEQGVTVYWIGLPPMRAAAHDEAVRAIAELQQKRVLASGAKYIDIRPAFSDDQGGYAESGVGIDGQMTRLRSLDGVKFIKAGNNKLAALVLDAIRADLGLGEPGLVVAEGGGATEQRVLPIFGTELARGGALTLEVSDLPEVDNAAIARTQLSRIDLDQGAETSAARGSAADALFATGRWPDPKPGRIDDFRWPQQP